jgi:hypothetical protein
VPGEPLDRGPPALDPGAPGAEGARLELGCAAGAELQILHIVDVEYEAGTTRSQREYRLLEALDRVRMALEQTLDLVGPAGEAMDVAMFLDLAAQACEVSGVTRAEDELVGAVAGQDITQDLAGEGRLAEAAEALEHNEASTFLQLAADLVLEGAAPDEAVLEYRQAADLHHLAGEESRHRHGRGGLLRRGGEWAVGASQVHGELGPAQRVVVALVRVDVWTPRASLVPA